MSFPQTRSLVLCLLSLSIFTGAEIAGAAATAQAIAPIKITSFNIRYFGLGGTMSGTPADEGRDASLREFMSRNVFPTDVIAFEEIVDVPRLQRLLPAGWSCITYSHTNPKHQFVVLCAANRFSFQRSAHDTNYAIESVAINDTKSRPALRADLVERATGRKVLRLIAVHLKAYPAESDTREMQSKKIAADIASANEYLPTVIVGDFNTYTAAQTGESRDDIERIEDGLAEAKVGKSIRHVPHRELYTYRSGNGRSQLDQYYLTEDLRPSGAPAVFSICNSNQAGGGFADPEYYYDMVSDHCPVALTVQL